MPASREQCFWAQNRIEAYIENELRGSERDLFDRHIESCEWCRKEFSLARAITNGLRELPPHRCPESVCENSAARAAVSLRATGDSRFEGPRARFLRSLRSAPIAVMAMILLVAISASLVILRHQNNPAGGAAPALSPSNEFAASGAVTEAEAETVINDVALAFSYVNKYSLRTGEVERQGTIIDRVMKSVYGTVVKSISPFPIKE